MPRPTDRHQLIKEKNRYKKKRVLCGEIHTLCEEFEAVVSC